jgi:hypothetical protein
MRERLFCVEREEPIWGREGNAGRSFGKGEKAGGAECYGWLGEGNLVREKNWKKNGRVGGGGSQRKEK